MKYIYFFEEGNKDMKDLLGNKGAGLSEMTNLGLSVPPGFTITTDACKEYIKTNKFPENLWNEVLEAMDKLEKKSNKKFGDEKNPLLVSVRSGAPVSMPGMMDTVLNVGLNDKTVLGLYKKTNNERFAYDSYRRLLQMYGKIVLNVPGEYFEMAMDELKKKYGVKNDVDLNASSLKELVEIYKKIIKDNGKEFPQDPYKQLELSIKAVFESWNNERAKVYRKLNNIPEDLGTAVSIVMMVFGNMGPDSATGVAFTRNPSTGEKVLFGEYLTNAQGEDVVAGIRTPKPISEMEMEEVFEARIHAFGVCVSSSLNIADFNSEFSVAASTTRSAFLTPSAIEVYVLILSKASFLIVSVIWFLLTCLCKFLEIVSSALYNACSEISIKDTLYPY